MQMHYSIYCEIILQAPKSPTQIELITRKNVKWQKNHEEN